MNTSEPSNQVDTVYLDCYLHCLTKNKSFVKFCTDILTSKGIFVGVNPSADFKKYLDTLDPQELETLVDYQ